MTKESRRIDVVQESPATLEYDREVKIELWHNQHQTTSLRLSVDEARTLLGNLAEFLTSKP